MATRNVRKAPKKTAVTAEPMTAEPVLVESALTDTEFVADSFAKSGLKSSLRMIEIEQDCSFGCTTAVVEQIVKDWSVIDKYYWVLHDKDFKEDCVTPRAPHIHLLLKFKSSVPTVSVMMRIVKICGRHVVHFNNFNRIKAWSSAVNYLTHRDEAKAWKHVYDVTEVHTNGDYELESEKGHDAKQLKKDMGRLTSYYKMIDSGELTPYNVAEHLSFLEEVTYGTELEKAFKIKLQREVKGEREMQVIFIEGESGVGKDTFARDWCHKQNLDYFTTNNNSEYPFDDYKGQPVIIWSDARDDVYKPRELHNLLDNHYNSKQKARYADKYITAKYILITSIKPLSSWYSAFYEKAGEDKFQLYRRIGMVVHMEKDLVTIKVLDYSKRQYITSCTLPNTFTFEQSQVKSREEALAVAKQFLGGMAELATFVSDNLENEALAPRYSLKDFCTLNVPSLMFGGDCPNTLKICNDNGVVAVLHAKYHNFDDKRPYCYFIGDTVKGYSEDDTRPVWHIVV